MDKQDFLNHSPKIFYGEFYGREKADKNAEYCEINVSSCKIIDSGIVYIWGWPGPDVNFYKWSDYGNTWALTKEELGNVKFYNLHKYDKEQYEVTFMANGEILNIEKIIDFPFNINTVFNKNGTITIKNIQTSNKETAIKIANKERLKYI